MQSTNDSSSERLTEARREGFDDCKQAVLDLLSRVDGTEFDSVKFLMEFILELELGL